MKKRILIIFLSLILALLFSAWFVFVLAGNAIYIEDILQAIQGTIKSDRLARILFTLFAFNSITIVAQVLLSFKLKLERNITNIISIIVSALAIGFCISIVIYPPFVGDKDMAIFSLLLALLPLTIFVISTISQIMQIKKITKNFKRH